MRRATPTGGRPPRCIERHTPRYSGRMPAATTMWPTRTGVRAYEAQRCTPNMTPRTPPDGPKMAPRPVTTTMVSSTTMTMVASRWPGSKCPLWFRNRAGEGRPGPAEQPSPVPAFDARRLTDERTQPTRAERQPDQEHQEHGVPGKLVDLTVGPAGEPGRRARPLVPDEHEPPAGTQGQQPGDVDAGVEPPRRGPNRPGRSGRDHELSGPKRR